METLLNFKISAPLVLRVKKIAAQADVDVQTVVEIALDRYFSQGRQPEETLSSILQKCSDEKILERLAYR